MRALLLLTFLFVANFDLQAQQEIYHVTSQTLNIRESASTSATIITKLKKYDNVEIIEQLTDWSKVKLADDQIGYAYASYLKEGKAIVTYTTVRTGAKCKDGTTSSATGRGACSHHGGVSYWITKKYPSVRIVDND